MAQQSSGGIIKWGLIALVGWYVYEHYLNAPAPVVAPSTGGPTPAPAPTPAPTPSPVTTPAASVLDGIYSRIVAAAPANAQLDPDNWGWYLNNELQALGKGAGPDPVPLFGARPQPAMSAAAWWGPVSQALKTQMGLSGLGAYGSLAALYGRVR